MGLRLPRPVAVVLLVIYLAAAAALFLWPRGGGLHGVHMQIWTTVRSLGVPASFKPECSEFMLNAVVFGIGVILICVVFYEVNVWFFVVAGVLVSFSIEYVQGFFLPDRNMDWVDVIANGLGALLGGVCVTLMCRAHKRHSCGDVHLGATS